MAKKRKRSGYRVVNIIPVLSEEERKRRERKTIEVFLSEVKRCREMKIEKNR